MQERWSGYTNIRQKNFETPNFNQRCRGTFYNDKIVNTSKEISILNVHMPVNIYIYVCMYSLKVVRIEWNNRAKYASKWKLCLLYQQTKDVAAIRPSHYSCPKGAHDRKKMPAIKPSTTASPHPPPNCEPWVDSGWDSIGY